MIQRNTYPVLVTGKEAAHICRFITGEELKICYSMYEDYLGSTVGKKKLQPTYDNMLAASFFYTVGRVQGIREERAKKEK